MLPPGLVLPYGGAAAPSGWLLCDGSAVSRTTYSLLFTAIGTAYGSGDGTSTFNVPDLRGRMPVGLGTHADVSTLGNNDGVGTVGNRRPAHKHTVGNPSVSISDPHHSHSISDPGHSHSYTGVPGTDTSGYNSSFRGDQPPTGMTTGAATTGVSVQSAATGITAAASGGTVGPQTGAEPTDKPAYLVVNFVIKT
jgi:microcystin-dependent protein